MFTPTRRRALAVACLVMASVPAVARPALATHEQATSPNGAQAVAACHDQADGLPIGPGTCRGVEQVQRDAAQLCRLPRVAGAPTPEAACSAVDGRSYSEDAMTDYEASWAHRALQLQARLDDLVPLRLALFPATHNSFNSAAYPPTLSGLDHNQVASLTDQLRMGMRSVELDVHWFPSPHADPADGGKAPILCHGQTQDVGGTLVHVGCTGERHLRDGLAEIATWLAANPDELLLLYLENQLDDDPGAHDAAARAIEAELGDRVYRPPPATPCGDLPINLSEAEILKTGQVLIVGNCGPGAWGGLVHDRGIPRVWNEDKSGDGDDFQCPAGGYADKFQRFYEDSTWLSYMSEPTGLGSPGEITADETAAMVACGVNLFGFDQLVPGDPRLARLVWSWAENEPSTGTAAYQGTDARFRSGVPDTGRRFACLDGDGWHVTGTAGAWSLGPQTCASDFPGSAFAVPATALENAALRAAAGGSEVWLDYAELDGLWTARSS